MSKLRSSRNWLGEVLKYLGEANPYPTSNDPSVKTVEPTADVPTDTGSQVADFYNPEWDLVARVKALRAQAATEIIQLWSLFQNEIPQQKGTVTNLGNGAENLPQAFYNKCFIACENSITDLTESNHALGWILAAVGTVAAPETPVVPLPDSGNVDPNATTTTQTGLPAAEIPDSPSSPTDPNALEPEAGGQGSGDGSPIVDQAQPNPNPEANGATTPTSSEPDTLTNGETPVIPVSDAQAFLNQIASDYPKLVSEVQEPMNLKQAQHIVDTYPDKAKRDEILAFMNEKHLSEMDASGTTSILSPYTSFNMIATQLEIEAEQKKAEVPNEDQKTGEEPTESVSESKGPTSPAGEEVSTQEKDVQGE